MLNKLQFNNLVITNKKSIQRGRIQAINKLVQKIRKLKAQLDKHPDNPKIKERLRKTTENLEYLKKLKCFDAIKKILLLENNPSTIITNGLSTPEEVALALLAQNKVMQDLIKNFKEQLNLTDTDLKWKEELLEPSKRRAKIDRTEEKKKKRKDVKEQKSNERKRLDWIKNNNPYMEEDVGISATGAWKIEPIEVDLKHSSISVNVPNVSKNPLIADNDLNETEMEIDITENVKHKTELKSKMLPRVIDENTKTKPKKINNVKSKLAKSSMNAINSNESYTITETEKKAVEKEETAPKVEFVVDPFFITETGENYVTTIVHIPDKTTNESADKKDETKEQSFLSGNRRTRRLLENNKRDEFKSNKNSAHDKHENSSNNSLHPSWAAKQKLKPFITSFQGKKTTFDDDDINGAYNKHTSMKTVSKKVENRSVSNNNAAQDKLHPSWAAKQKLKPTIAAFEGKKISFTNEFDED